MTEKRIVSDLDAEMIRDDDLEKLRAMPIADYLRRKRVIEEMLAIFQGEIQTLVEPDI